MLDRLNRKHIMIASDLVRAVVALCFILTHRPQRHLAALRAQRAADGAPRRSSPAAARPSCRPSPRSEELHTANSLTQTTQWTTLAIGTFLGGTSVMAVRL